MTPDANFDPIASDFEEEIYGSSKGYVRLLVLWEDLLSEVPRMGRGGLSVLDAGGGAGRVALRMARLGNDVVLCDPSREMLDRAEEAIGEADHLAGSITTVMASIQDLHEVVGGEFDVVTCHAVLEWLADPEAALGRFTAFLKRDGSLSLMFYNRNASLLKRILGGDFVAARPEHDERPPRSWGDGATPLAEETVRKWLDELGLEVRSRAGVRIFHDHLSHTPPANDGAWLDDLVEVEKGLRKREPFASLGQHLHLVCGWRR